MRISKKTEYALRALVAMARPPVRSWSIHDLASGERIPIKFLEQILLALRRAGLLHSKRGVGGGYTFLRAPDEIRLGEVIEIFDGPLAPIPCAAERPHERCTCPEPRTCSVRLAMSGIRRDLAALLAARTIEDMLKLSPGPQTLAFDI
jgi:Rrf2 family protein